MPIQIDHSQLKHLQPFFFNNDHGPKQTWLCLRYEYEGKEIVCYTIKATYSTGQFATSTFKPDQKIYIE